MTKLPVQQITFEQLSTLALEKHQNQTPHSPPIPRRNNDSFAISMPAKRHYVSARSQVLQLGADVGALCSQMLSHSPLDPHPDTLEAATPPTHGTAADQSSYNVISQPAPQDRCAEDEVEGQMARLWSCSTSATGQECVYEGIARVFWRLVVLCNVCRIDLRSCILKKIELNGKKYPVHLCKGKRGKYTVYSSQTGITKTNQSTLDIDVDSKTTPQQNSETKGNSTQTPPQNPKATTNGNSNTTVSDVQQLIRVFATERQWSKYHTPRNIVLAMMGEVGELAELFQWRGDHVMEEGGLIRSEDWTVEQVDGVGQEVADVAIYCVRLADVVGIEDLGYLVYRLGDK